MCLGASCRRLLYNRRCNFHYTKSPSQQICCKGRVLFSRFHPACSAARSCQDAKPLNYDDNGITGPDWGLQKVLWIRSSQPAASLSGITFPTYSSLHRVFICLIIASKMWLSRSSYRFLPQHFLYFLPEPHGHGSFLPIFFSLRIVVDSFCSL